jgi:uncharacterized membrane protein
VATAALTLRRSDPPARLAPIRHRLGRWLGLALELLIGGDIIRTAVAPTWNDIGQLAAIVALRVVIEYTLIYEE